MPIDPTNFIPESVRCYGKRYIANWRKTRTTLTTYDYWRSIFIAAALSRFEWQGLPQQIDTRYLELVLLGWGSGAFTRRLPGHSSDPENWWFGKVTEQGTRDIYDNPVRVDVRASNGYHKTRHTRPWVKKIANQHKTQKVVMAADAVLVWDNDRRAPLLPYIDLQARRLAEMDAAIDTQVNALKVPYLLSVSEEGRANAEKMYNQIASGQPAIYTSPTISGVVDISVLQSMPAGNYAGDVLLNDQLKIVSAVYTMLGIDNNAAAEKKERVQTAETLANNEQFLIQRRSALLPRQRACEQLETIGLPGVSCIWAIPHTDEDLKGGVA